MANLIYGVIASFDGYIEDQDGSFDWAVPDARVHRFVNEIERPVGTYLYGRRMYEVMVAWESDELFADGPAHEREYADIWRAADKIVYSRSLTAVSSARTSLQREFDLEAVRQMKASAERDIGIAGPELAAHAIRADLVDEYYFLIAPVVVGSGKPAFPADARVELELTEERRFDNGMVYLRYRTRR